MIRVVSAAVFLLMGISCSAVSVPTLEAKAAAPVSPQPVSNVVYITGELGNISRFQPDIELTVEELLDSVDDFPSVYYDGNTNITGIEWVLRSARLNYSGDSSSGYSLSLVSAVFTAYHSYGTYYGSSAFGSLPLKFICSTDPGDGVTPCWYSWSSVGMNISSNKLSASAVSSQSYTRYGNYLSSRASSTGPGPYLFRLSGYYLDGVGLSAVQLIEDICVSYASATVSQYQASNYLEGYQEGYSKGKSDGESIGYQRGYRDGADSSNNELMLIPTLFGAIANVPISIFGGMGDLAIWNVPIISVIFTFLFIALVLWLVRKFI